MPSQTGSHLKATVARNIDAAISAQGMTNREVGDAIGSTEHQVWRWRRGKVMPNSDNLAALAVVLHEGDISRFFFNGAEPKKAA